MSPPAPLRHTLTHALQKISLVFPLQCGSRCRSVMDNNLNQDEAVDDQEEQSGQPDGQEGVVAFELQEVGGAQPSTLAQGENTLWLNWN